MVQIIIPSFLFFFKFNCGCYLREIFLNNLTSLRCPYSISCNLICILKVNREIYFFYEKLSACSVLTGIGLCLISRNSFLYLWSAQDALLYSLGTSLKLKEFILFQYSLRNLLSSNHPLVWKTCFVLNPYIGHDWRFRIDSTSDIHLLLDIKQFCSEK